MITPPFEMNEPAIDLYTSMQAYADEDEANGWALAHWCNAIGGMFAEVNDLVSDRDEGIGWSVVMDVDRAPTKWLGWLAQFIGVVIVSGLDDASQRLRIQETDGFKRGKPSAIKGAARAALTGDRRVVLTERHGSPWLLTVATYASETPDPAAVVLRMKEQKPAGDKIIHDVIAGGDYSTLHATHSDYNDVAATFTDYNDIISDPSQT